MKNFPVGKKLSEISDETPGIAHFVQDGRHIYLANADLYEWTEDTQIVWEKEKKQAKADDTYAGDCCKAAKEFWKKIDKDFRVPVLEWTDTTTFTFDAKYRWDLQRIVDVRRSHNKFDMGYETVAAAIKCLFKFFKARKDEYEEFFVFHFQDVVVTAEGDFFFKPFCGRRKMMPTKELLADFAVKLLTEFDARQEIVKVARKKHKKLAPSPATRRGRARRQMWQPAVFTRTPKRKRTRAATPTPVRSQTPETDTVNFVDLTCAVDDTAPIEIDSEESEEELAESFSEESDESEESDDEDYTPPSPKKRKNKSEEPVIADDDDVAPPPKPKYRRVFADSEDESDESEEPADAGNDESEDAMPRQCPGKLPGVNCPEPERDDSDCVEEEEEVIDDDIDCVEEEEAVPPSAIKKPRVWDENNYLDEDVEYIKPVGKSPRFVAAESGKQPVPPNPDAYADVDLNSLDTMAALAEQFCVPVETTVDAPLNCPEFDINAEDAAVETLGSFFFGNPHLFPVF